MIEALLVVLLVAALAALGVGVAVLIRQRDAAMVPALIAALQARLDAMARDGERLERELRGALAESRRESAEAARAARAEQTAALDTLSRANEERFDSLRTAVEQGLGGTIAEGRHARAESAARLERFGETLQQSLRELTAANDRRLAELREAVERRLAELAAGNEKKLDEMRLVVDEKLHRTLETRLAESFRHVSERLEQVHKGLGEMQTLAAGVGDLKRVLSNVKARGVLGEVQLHALLEQILAPGQYARNVATRPGTDDRVEFAIRLPGRDEATGVVWLPIDAKFPLEDYERLVRAQEAADAEAAETAGRALEARVRLEARAIADKYLEPPATTDFALLYLPFEGLYAEVLRRPGLFDGLQREHRVTVCGPTTLTAILNSLQLGFRTLAIEKRSSEVWQVLGAVKTEFAKFGDVLAKTRKKLEEATNTIGAAETRTRVIERKLRGVEALPVAQAAELLEAPVEGVPETGEVTGNVVRLPEER
jgi:DNA recombination protein RmuC